MAAATLEVLWRPHPMLELVFVAQNQGSLAPAFLAKCFTVPVSKLLFSEQSQCLSRDFAVRGCDASGMRLVRRCSVWYLCRLLQCCSPTEAPSSTSCSRGAAVVAPLSARPGGETERYGPAKGEYSARSARAVGISRCLPWM